MDKTVSFLEHLPPESLKLTINQQPFFQRQHSDYWSIENANYSDYDLFICTGGNAEFSQGDEICMVREGTAFLAVPGIPLCAKHKGADYFNVAAQHFDLKIFGEIDFFSLINYRRLIQFTDWEYVSTLVGRCKKLLSNGIKRLEQYSLFHSILFEFIYDAFLSENKNQQREFNFIFQILSFIQEHLTEENVLGNALLLSPYSHDYTSRVFKKKVGAPPKQYILRLRLNLGRTLLLQEGFSIKEIAYRCGFSDELYFSRLFRKYLDMSPGEFRKQHMSIDSGY